MPDHVRRAEVLSAIGRYSAARREFLQDLGIAASNRDPLAEFAERFVALLVDGELASSRVAKGYDLVDSEGRSVQVRYLANPSGSWINEHLVEFDESLDAYALLVVEALEPTAVLWFGRGGLAQVCWRLGKRHGNQDVRLQLTQRNAREILEAPTIFRPLGVRVWRAPDWIEADRD